MRQLQELKERLLFETKQSNAFRFKRNDAKTEKARKGWQILIDLADQSKDKLREQIKILESEGMKAPVKKTGKKKVAPRKKKTATKKPAGKKVATKRCEPTPAQRAARKEFATNAKKAAQLVRSGKAKNIKAAWKQIK